MRLAFRRSNDSADSPPYLSLLKLHTPPFSSKAGSEFFYADEERSQYLNMLQHFTQYSEELLLVVGDEGIGKTTLLEKYLERREEHWQLCRLAGEQGIGLDTLYARVAHCFGLDLAGVEPAQLLDTLRQHLDALLEQQLSVLVIDDAHALSDDALEMVFHLAALEGEHGKLIRVLLFADTAIDTRLAFPRFTKIDSPHRLQLKALEEKDSSAYLLHRLQQAGYSGPSPFSASELAHLHRQARGVPARLNQLAHQLLLARSQGESSAPFLSIGRVKLGVAATALIGTMLGMHERINALLGGEPDASMGVTAERPVLRLADQDNPWAVVIRDGESIQISCGPPTSQTVAVRPTPASKPLASQAVMQQPLLQPITVAEEPVATSAEPAAVSEEPAAAEGEAVAQPEVVAAVEPLVIKPQPDITPELPPVVQDEVQSAPQEPVQPVEAPALTLEGVEPDPVVGSEAPQTITLLGNGLVADSKVALSHSGKVEVLAPSQVAVRDAGHLSLTFTTGVEAGGWAVQLSAPDGRRSNVLRFEVIAPSKEAEEPEAVAEVATPLPAQTAESAEPKAAPAAPKAAEPLATPAEEEKPRAKPAAAQEKSILGSHWISAQPDGNYTLQLLASSERKSLQAFVAAHPGLMAPLGSFEQQRGDKRLYVLTQGSYPSRSEAEAAAKALPEKLQPWPRDFAGIKKAMLSPAPASKPLEGGIKDTAWVWSQDPGHYTIQLAGASSEAAIEAVMHGISLPGELAVVQTQRQGKPWYSLIYGRFVSREAAQGTLARLPESLKRAEPWPRRFSALQDEIGRSSAR